MAAQETTGDLRMALLEASLRLAWYLRAYGAIPELEMQKLMIAGGGIITDQETDALLDEARKIRDYLIELGSNS